MHREENFRRILNQHPHRHVPFYARPHMGRRQFFRLLGAGVTASFVPPRLKAELVKSVPVNMRNTARNVIFILLTGAPSHTDLFDLKVIEGTTPAAFNPTTINGLLWPAGVLTKLGNHLESMAIIRSVRAWNLQHSLGQMWVQIGRNPTAALGDVAPNIGSIVAVEKGPEAKPGQMFPPFLALNSAQAIGSGYLKATYAPFRVAPSAAGLANTTHADGQARFEEKFNILQQLDGMLRVNSPFGNPMEDYGDFYQAARGLMYNPTVDKAFRFTAADSARYGGTGFGNACLVAKQVLEANQGTRYIQISLGGWDMHADIYGTQNPRGNNIFTLGRQLDDGLSELMADLKSNGLFQETLIVMMGEFGRTVGPLTNQGGRDHFLQQFCVFAGAGVRGGRAIGQTDERGALTTDAGWSEGRDVRAEDIEATIYSAMGINWTSVRYDDPFGRGFEYVPGGKDGLYKPVDELWT
jgi:hypothetical protein